MFDQYLYLNKLVTFIPEGEEVPAIPEIKSVKRISGLKELEELLEDLRGLKYPVIMPEDKGDGYLSFSGGNLDNAYHTFYLVTKVKLENSEARVEARKTCMTIALKVFKIMIAEGENFGDPCYGFDRDRIDYQQVGPIADNFYGYAFSYIVKDENFGL